MLRRSARPGVRATPVSSARRSQQQQQRAGEGEHQQDRDDAVRTGSRSRWKARGCRLALREKMSGMRNAETVSSAPTATMHPAHVVVLVDVSTSARGPTPSTTPATATPRPKRTANTPAGDLRKVLTSSRSLSRRSSATTPCPPPRWCRPRVPRSGFERRALEDVVERARGEHRPSAMIATESQMRSMSSMLWLDSNTVPPASVKRRRMSMTMADETGSTDSNGSSSTSSRGEWIIAAAIAIFFVMPDRVSRRPAGASSSAARRRRRGRRSDG